MRRAAAALAIVILAAGWPPGSFGQAPAPPYYAMDPTMPLSPRAAGPVQQQILENYRTQLLQTQREGLQQNPSGVGRDQLEISRQLNAFGGPAATAPTPASTVPSPPFNAAPRP